MFCLFLLSLSVGQQSVSVSATATAVSEPSVSAVVSVTAITGLQLRRHFRPLRPKPEKVVSVGLYGKIAHNGRLGQHCYRAVINSITKVTGIR